MLEGNHQHPIFQISFDGLGYHDWLFADGMPVTIELDGYFHCEKGSKDYHISYVHNSMTLLEQILLLLYRSGYMVGQYISIEKAIADTKEAYYDALQKADQGWHDGTNDPKPFIKYMLSIILSCYKEFEARVSIAHTAGARSTSYDIVKAYVKQRIGKISKQEVLIGCPSLGSSSVEAALKKLVEEGTLVRIGAGRKTLYARADSVIDRAI